MKGKRKEITKEELHSKLKIGFNVNYISSEYGMSELLSQAYSDSSELFTTPPWMKILIRDTNDPLTLINNGKTGGINVIDLANLYSCSFIATQDLGRIVTDQFYQMQFYRTKPTFLKLLERDNFMFEKSLDSRDTIQVIDWVQSLNETTLIGTMYFMDYTDVVDHKMYPICDNINSNTPNEPDKHNFNLFLDELALIQPKSLVGHDFNFDYNPRDLMSKLATKADQVLLQVEEPGLEETKGESSF
jgi:hypothetical protein